MKYAYKFPVNNAVGLRGLPDGTKFTDANGERFHVRRSITPKFGTTVQLTDPRNGSPKSTIDIAFPATAFIPTPVPWSIRKTGSRLPWVVRYNGRPKAEAATHERAVAYILSTEAARRNG